MAEDNYSFRSIQIIVRNQPPNGFTGMVPVKGALYLDSLHGHLYQSDRAGRGRDVYWSRFGGGAGGIGDPGEKGDPGTDGKTSHLHVAYATAADGSSGFSTSDPVGKTYLGVYTDFEVDSSTTPSDYLWTLIKGAKGDKGDPGTNGAKGDPGTNGAKGDKGDPGTNGAKGDKGDPGTDGTPWDPTTLPGYNAGSTQTLNNVEGILTWVDAV